MLKYFVNCGNLDALKAEYRKQAMIHHPDMGGDTATMQAINAEYEARFEVLKRSQNEQAAEDTTGKTQATSEAPSDFIGIINALLHMEGLTVELCGRWLWIGGRTMEHRDELKAAGCRWSSTKKLWSWHHIEDGAKWHKSHYSMEHIRSKYGSERFASQDDGRAAIAG
jgi:curved DNA-binding protein CbpA